MIAVCKCFRSRSLANHQRGRFANVDESFALTVDESYVVLGIGIWETVLHVLVQDDNGLPAWCPAALFEMTPQKIPDGWLLGTCDGIKAPGAELWTRWVMKTGYPELVESERHSDLLLERDPDALAIFERELRRRTAEA